MIEKIVIDYLSGALAVPVGPQAPEGPPASYCTVERRGGDEKDELQAALIAVHSIAPSLWEALTLSGQVKTAMKTLRYDCADVFSCRLTSEYNNTDSRTKEYRYTAIFRVVYVDD